MRILITGGTGSLGQELIKQILESRPPQDRDDLRLIVYSRDEQKQEIMREKFPDERLSFFLGDVRDKLRLSYAVWGVDLVIHAAALKIVPALEANPWECLKTNIIGTQNLIEAVHEKSYTGTYTKVIGVSTDKAVSPTNLYGASKLCAEKLLLAANNIYRPAIFSVVRYGNVAGSRGSVIPKFIAQKASGAPITLTHEDMTRYYITLQDAAKFVLNCVTRMKGGEVFLPPMKSFKVAELAGIIDQGSTPNGVTITGIRPGEKLHEELISEHEMRDAKWHNDFKYHTIYSKEPGSLLVFAAETTSEFGTISRDELHAMLQRDGFL